VFVRSLFANLEPQDALLKQEMSLCMSWHMAEWKYSFKTWC